MADREKLYADIVQFLKNHDRYLITAHMNADGDAYASCLAIAYLLHQWGKSFEIILHDERKEDKYAFLWGWQYVQSYRDGMNKQFAAAVVLDVPSLKRIGGPSSLLPQREYCVKIDHHPLEDDFAALQLVDVQASSTSQLVYEVVSRSGISWHLDIATLLFTGIMYDTGRFSFSNTSARDFEIAARLVPFGIRPHEIANRIFFNNSFDSMKVIGYGLANMEAHLDGKVSIIFLPLEIMQQNNHSEIEELANYSVAIKGVEVGLFIREVKPGYFKVSFRSKGRVNVNQVAKAFGGGGHEHAAGCRIQTNYSELKQRLIEEIARQLPEVDAR
ncbi:MAG: bifunctional oligoribonuclease/PAP phosphatase NrnA [Calditrichaeota bacterium]|nr:bifunctional oligoribonuclease/PAP phosphatase NrnA [Calditrichota bacterium]